MNQPNRTISDGEPTTVPSKHIIKKDVERNALTTRSMEQMTVTPAPKPALRKSRSAPHGQLRNNSFYMEPAPVPVYLNSTSPPQMQRIPTMQPIQRIPSMQPYVYSPPPYVPYSAPSFYYSPPPPAPTYIIRRNPPPAVPYDCYGPNFDACFGPDVRPIHNTSTVAQQREQLEAIQLSRSTYRDRLPNARNNDNNMSVAEAKALEEAIQLSLTESSRRACRNEQSTDFSHTTGEGNSGYTTATSSSKSHHWAEHIAKSASADDKALQEAILQSLHESSSMEDCVPYPAPAILNEYEDHTLSTPAHAAANYPVDSPDSYQQAITSNPNSVDRQYPYNLTPEFRKKSSFTLQDGNSNWKSSSFMLPEPPAASAGRIDRWSMEHPREQEQFSSQSPPQMQPPHASSHTLQYEPPHPRHLRQTSYVSGPTEPNTPLNSEREPTQSSGRTDYEDNEYDHEVHATAAADVYARQHHLHRVEEHPHRRRVRSPPPPYIGDDEEDEVTPLSDYYEENSHPHPHPGPTARVSAHLHARHDSDTAIAPLKDQQYLTYESDYQSHHKEHGRHRDVYHHHHRQSYHETSRHRSPPPRGYEHVPVQQHTHHTTTMSRRHASASPPRHRHSNDAATAAGHSSVYASSGTDTDHCSWYEEESRRQGHLHHQPVHHENHNQPVHHENHNQPVLHGNHHYQPVHYENHHQPVHYENHHQPVLHENHHHQPVHYENHHQSVRHEQHNYHHTGHARSGQPHLHPAAVPVSYESYPSGSESSAYQSDHRHHLNYGSDHHPSSHNHYRRSYPPHSSHSHTLNLPPPAAFPDESRGSKHPPPTIHIHAHHRDTPTTTTTTHYHPDTRPRHHV